MTRSAPHRGSTAWARAPGGVGRFMDPRSEAAFREHQAQDGHRAIAFVLLVLAVLGTLAGGLDYLRLESDRFNQASILRTVYVVALLLGAWLAWQRPSSYYALLPLTALLASATTAALLLRYDPEQVSVMGAALLFVFATLVFLNVVSSNAAIRALVGSVNLIAAGVLPWLVQGSEPEGRVMLAIALAWTSILLLWFSAHREERLRRQHFASMIELRHQATHDPLTGLPNRRGFFEALDALVERYRNPTPLPVALAGESGATTDSVAKNDVLGTLSPAPRAPTTPKTDLVLGMLDLDHFKRVNDRHGHDAGDLVLRALADTLTLRDTSVQSASPDLPTTEITGDIGRSTPSGIGAFRMGGEEFALILEVDREDPVTPVDRLEALIDAIRHLRIYSPSGQAIRMRASCGAVQIDPRHTPITNELLSEALVAADRLLYRAKHRGRDRVYLETFTASPAPPTSNDLNGDFDGGLGGELDDEPNAEHDDGPSAPRTPDARRA